MTATTREETESLPGIEEIELLPDGPVGLTPIYAALCSEMGDPVETELPPLVGSVGSDPQIAAPDPYVAAPDGTGPGVSAVVA